MIRLFNRSLCCKGKLHFVLLAIVCCITFFANNKLIAPDIMECRNIVTAREMTEQHNWLVPTMNGELRLAKPPLPTYFSALVQMIAPDNLALQRGMAGLAALMLVFFFYRMAKQILHIDANIAVLFLCTCWSVILVGRTASWDIYCHAFMTGSIFCFSKAMSMAGMQYKRFFLAGVMAGLSFMSKGPVSFYAMFLPYLAAFILTSRFSFKGKLAGIAVMVATASVIGGWWFVYLYVFEQKALHEVAMQESHSWLHRNVRPWWYYWKFFLETGVWSLLLLTAMLQPVLQRAVRNTSWKSSVLWLVFSLVLLSVLPEKKSRYLFPILIPACYVMTSLVEIWKGSIKTNRMSRIFFRANSIIISIALLSIAFAFPFFAHPQNRAAHISLLLFLIVAAAAACMSVVSVLKCRVRILVIAVVSLFLAAECWALPLLERYINNPGMKSVSRVAEMETLKSVPFYHLKEEPLRIEMVYAAHRVVRPLEANDSVALMKSLPCVLLTHDEGADMIAASCRPFLDITDMGTFDDNHRPKNSRRYSRDFIYNLKLIKKK